MGIGPILSWEKEDKLKIFKKIFPGLILTLLATIIIFLIYNSYSLIGLIGIALAFWIIFNIRNNKLEYLAKRNSYKNEN